MARLLTTGAEWNDIANAAVTNHPDPAVAAGITAPTISAANPRTGTYAYRCSSGTTSSVTFAVTATTAVTYYYRAYVSVTALPTAGGFIRLFDIGAVAGSNVHRLYIADDGTISRTASAAVGGPNFVTSGSYFLLEASIKIDTGNAANGVFAWSLNGTIVETLTGLSGTTLPTTFQTGIVTNTSAGSMTVDVDDVAINDSTGGSQNSWAGSGRVVLLRPTADSAVGTGWTLGNATATGGNAWSRLNKAPPDSAADLTTTADADQIRNATSNANVNYDATMTTYTAAGMGVSDSVNVVVPQITTGAPVVTSAKAGTVGVASNPTIANVSLGAAGTAGAFWQGVAIGTYPTGVKWSFGTTTYAPSVTAGTAPVMRVTQVTASTRIAVVSEMGIYVDYTPAPVIPPTPLVHQSIPFYPRASRPS